MSIIKRLQNNDVIEEDITTFEAYGRELTEIPIGIFSLINLKKLNMSRNKNITIIPDEIGNLVNLEKIDLSDNNISVIPDTMRNLVNLRELNLGCQKILVLPEWIGELKQLKILNIGHNEITHIPDTIGNLVELEQLNMQCNQITTIPDSIGNLVKLRYLDLLSNNITVIPDAIGKLVSLKFLGIMSNDIKVLPEALATLENCDMWFMNNHNIEVPPQVAKMFDTHRYNILQSVHTSVCNVLKDEKQEYDSNDVMNCELSEKTKHMLVNILPYYKTCGQTSRIPEVFGYVWNRIIKHERKDEMIKILDEQFNNKSYLCCCYMCILKKNIDVLHGFYDDVNIYISGNNIGMTKYWTLATPLWSEE